jgi:quercetin dioxygenase-like cupin family protein
MKASFRIGLLAGVLLTAIGLALALDPAAKPIVFTNATGNWADCPGMPPGCKMFVLYGDPAKAGEFGVRYNFAAKYRIGPHQHAVDEHATVISGGPFHVGVGDMFDDKTPSGQTLHAGDLVVMPAGLHHFAWMDGETVLQVNGIGPFKREFINPANSGSGVPK